MNRDIENAFVDHMRDELQNKGLQNTAGIQSMEDVRDSLRLFSVSQRKDLRRTAKDYVYEHQLLLQQMTAPRFCPRVLKRVIAFVISGFMSGMSAAAIVNTIAPGLFATLSGFLSGWLVGKGSGHILVEIGLFSIGAFSTPMISSTGILVIGGMIGVICSLPALLFRSLSVSAKKKRIWHN